MKKQFLCMLMIGLYFATMCSSCFAASKYIMPDSDKRILTQSELEAYSYEALGYMAAEIYARHHSEFPACGRYDNYFRLYSWYKPSKKNALINPADAYQAMSQIERDNLVAIDEVRDRIRESGANHANAIGMEQFLPPASKQKLDRFTYLSLKANQSFHVYSAPDEHAWHETGGLAVASSNGAVYACGWENGWMVTMFATTKGALRVGYVKSDEIRGKKPALPEVRFEYSHGVLTENCDFRFDPVRMKNPPVAALPAGTEVIYLTTFYNTKAWDYIQVVIDGQVTRGFLEQGNIRLDMGSHDDFSSQIGL